MKFRKGEVKESMNVISPIKRAKGARKAISVVAVLVLLVALLPAVPAWAASSITPSTSAIGKTETYTITFEPASVTIGDLKGKNLTLKFPSGFDVTSLNGKTLDVVVEDATTAQKDYMQPVATVSGQNVTVNLPAAAFKNTTGSSAPKITFFNSITVKNPATAGSYTVELWLEGKTSAIDTVSVTISADYPKTVNITALSPTTVKVGGTFNIEVEVKNLADQPLASQNVTVDVVGVTTVSTLTTNSLGKATGTVTIPAATKPGTYQVVATAGSVSSAAQTITVTAGDPAKIEFVDENNQPITTTSGTVGQRQKLTVALFDAQSNLTAVSSDLVVVLSARDDSNNLAGKFYNAATGGSEIDRVTIPAGQSKVDFWFAPSLTGGNVTATVQGVTGWTHPTDTISFNAAQVGNITSVSLGAASSIFTTSATFGYAFKTTVSLDAIADRDYTVKVEFGSGDEGTWDTIFNPSLVGAKKSGDTFTIPAGSKSKPIYIYPKSASGTFDVTVTVVGTSANDTESYTVSPVTGNRKTLTSGWVVVSTPVELAGNGDFKALFGLTDANVNDYIASILTYENGGWVTVSSSAKLEPLKAYFVKLKQGVTATYVWKLNTSPQTPAQRNLAAGWNLVGVSAPLGTDGALNAGTGADESQFFRPVESALLAAVNAETGTAYKSGSTDPVSNGDAYWVSLSGPATIYSLAVPPYVAE